MTTFRVPISTGLSRSPSPNSRAKRRAFGGAGAGRRCDGLCSYPLHFGATLGIVAQCSNSPITFLLSSSQTLCNGDHYEVGWWLTLGFGHRGDFAARPNDLYEDKPEVGGEEDPLCTNKLTVQLARQRIEP